jgi:hypothetical protein
MLPKSGGLSDYARANLYGSVGHFEGALVRKQYSFSGESSLIQDDYSLEMFSAVPARLGLARPFLFDDSLHLIVICEDPT